MFYLKNKKNQTTYGGITTVCGLFNDCFYDKYSKIRPSYGLGVQNFAVDWVSRLFTVENVTHETTIPTLSSGWPLQKPKTTHTFSSDIDPETKHRRKTYVI